MLSQRDYIRLTVELNLFFTRIMREHCLFVSCAVPPCAGRGVAGFESCRKSFDSLLCDCIAFAGISPPQSSAYADCIVTPVTHACEVRTAELCCVKIDTAPTLDSMQLLTAAQSQSGISPRRLAGTYSKAVRLNENARQSCSRLLLLMTRSCALINDGKAFTWLYPSFMLHMAAETKYYLTMLNSLCQGNDIFSGSALLSQQEFWDLISAEHAVFLAGMLDPSQSGLREEVMGLARTLEGVRSRAMVIPARVCERDLLFEETIRSVTMFRDFCSKITEGVLDTKVKGVMLPLIPDHFVREANFYLWMLSLDDFAGNAPIISV